MKFEPNICCLYVTVATFDRGKVKFRDRPMVKLRNIHCYCIKRMLLPSSNREPNSEPKLYKEMIEVEWYE